MNQKHLGLIAIATITGLAQAGMAQAAVAPNYALSLLPTLGGIIGVANGVSDNGVIAGSALKASSSSTFVFYATTWDSTGAAAIGTQNTQAFAVNNAGQWAGNTYAESDQRNVHATVWQGGVAKDLGTMNYDSQARAINDAGLVAGWSAEDFSCCQVATMWNAVSGQKTSLSNTESAAYAINASGQVAGWANVGGTMLATLWSGTQTINLGAPGDVSVAYGINDAGQVVGTSWNSASLFNAAVLWNGTTATQLASFGFGAYAVDINNRGLIVGSSIGNAQHASLWLGTEIIDLNTYLPSDLADAGWILTYATSVNDDGWIVGMAENSTNGDLQRRAFLLTPVPEASTGGMTLLGLLAVATCVQRRRRAGMGRPE